MIANDIVANIDAASGFEIKFRTEHVGVNRVEINVIASETVSVRKRS